MAPPKLDDDVALLEISVALAWHPDRSFAWAYKHASSSVKIHAHSEDSARRRLQRKYNKERSHWTARGQQELRDRRAERVRQIEIQARESTRALQEFLAPQFVAVQKALEDFRPALLAAERWYYSSEYRQMIALARNIQSYA